MATYRMEENMSTYHISRIHREFIQLTNKILNTKVGEELE
jgi:hypothetical protein